jgi:hypothetical protein
MSAPAPTLSYTPTHATGSIKETHVEHGSWYHFSDIRGGTWIISFFYGPGETKERTLKNLFCEYYEPQNDDSLNDFSGSDLHQTKYGTFAQVSSHILLTAGSFPAMVDLINCAGTVPEMFKFLMSVLSSPSTSSEEQSHLSDLAGLVKFVNQINAKKSEKISKRFQVIDPENITKFEETFPPTFGWVRAFCAKSFRQTIAHSDVRSDIVLERSLKNFAHYCRDKIKKNIAAYNSETEIAEFMNQTTSEQVVTDWLATLV